MAWLQGYQHRKKLEIDYTKIDSDLTNFPVAVILNSSRHDFSKGNANGYDTRFTSSDGETLLKYERERHDSSNSLAEYHTKIPAVSSSANTIFYFYYRTETTEDGADPTNVWDSNFKGVWHKNDLTTSSIKDSTANGNNGTKKAVNEPIETEGKIGKAQSYDGTDDYIRADGVTAYLTTTELTFEGWAKPTAVKRGAILSFHDSSGNNRNIVFWAQDGSSQKFYYYDDSTNYIASASTFALDWHFIVITIDSSNNGKLYVNSNIEGTFTTSVRPPTNGRFSMGQEWDANTPTDFFQGLIDEVRVSKIARSAAWIKASYHSGNDSLLSYGEEEKRSSVVPMFFIR